MKKESKKLKAVLSRKVAWTIIIVLLILDFLRINSVYYLAPLILFAFYLIVKIAVKSEKIEKDETKSNVIASGIVVLGIIGFYFLNYRSKNQELYCANYDENQQECLSHPECEWSSDMNCNSKDMDGEDNEGLNQELEAITVPDNSSNTLCKKIPLSNQPPYGERYHCLALVNHDERFCEGMDEEKEKLMCLAFAKEDPSYCEKIQNQEPRRVCYIQLSVSSKNIKFCDGIYSLDKTQENKEEKLQCYMNYITNLYAWDKSDEIKIEYCNEFPEDYEDRDTCFALKKRDISLCNNVANCLTFFKQDVSFCDEHPELPCCIKDRAKTSKDVSICELLPQPERDDCVGSYCTHTELDVNICDTIEDIGERQNRYLELAMNLANW